MGPEGTLVQRHLWWDEGHSGDGIDHPLAQGIDMTALTAMQTIWLRVAPLVILAREFEDLSPGEQAVVYVLGTLLLLVLLALKITVLYLLYKDLEAVPAEFRRMEPSLVWLLLVPCFHLIWNFFVYTRVARSYQDYFHDRGQWHVGDCGAGIGIAYSVCTVLIWIPCVNYVTGIFCGPAIIVLLILYLVKLHGLKKEIASAGEAAFDDDPQADLI